MTTIDPWAELHQKGSCDDGALEETVGAIICAVEQERLGYLCRR
jgi:hypothetical protein